MIFMVAGSSETTPSTMDVTSALLAQHQKALEAKRKAKAEARRQSKKAKTSSEDTIPSTDTHLVASVPPSPPATHAGDRQKSVVGDAINPSEVLPQGRSKPRSDPVVSSCAVASDTGHQTVCEIEEISRDPGVVPALGPLASRFGCPFIPRPSVFFFCP